jgi:hypothetical protein
MHQKFCDVSNPVDFCNTNKKMFFIAKDQPWYAEEVFFLYGVVKLSSFERSLLLT